MSDRQKDISPTTGTATQRAGAASPPAKTGTGPDTGDRGAPDMDGAVLGQARPPVQQVGGGPDADPSGVGATEGTDGPGTGGPGASGVAADAGAADAPPGTSARIEWTADGVPASVRFADPYYALGNGLAETRHVFLAGNDLPARFAPGFHVAELGFGTGLNMLAAWLEWRRAGIAGPLRFTSFEAFPMARADMARALRAFPELAPLAAEFLPLWSEAGGCLSLSGVTLEVVIGDVRDRLPRWQDAADAWFLDGFAPARNPEMWEPGLMRAVFAHTRPGGTAATYSAAGAVRRALQAAGFTVERAAGYGRKRHMTRAWKAPDDANGNANGDAPRGTRPGDGTRHGGQGRDGN